MTLPSTSMSSDECPSQHASLDWSSLKEIAGEPTSRLFTQKERLFGAQVPSLRLWHDSAAWHPFANQVWLLIEEMQIPHVRATVPLDSYLKPGEHISPEFQKLGVSVPAIQLAGNAVSNYNKKEKWSAPIKESSAVDICCKLNKVFPDHALMPRTPRRRAFAEALLGRYSRLQRALYSLLGGAGSRAHGEYISAMDEFDGAWSGNSSATFSLTAFGDDGDGSDKFFGGSLEGPFLFGKRPCAVDLILLPLLERCEANVPHPLIGNASHLGIDRWPALARLQSVARIPGVCAYGELGTDAKTTVGIRFDLWGIPIELPSLHSIPLHHLLNNLDRNALDARRDAASRLISNHVAITRFACAGAGLGRSRQIVRPTPDENTLSSTNEALHAVAQILLVESMPGSSVDAIATQAVTGLFAKYGPEAARRTGVNLVFLAENTGVPRDMTAAPAAAFREHLYLIAAFLSKVGHSRQ